MPLPTSDLIPGEIIALQQIEDGGRWRLAAICASAQGAAIGVLVAPRNGSAGQIGFEPVPRLAEGLDAEAAVILAEQTLDAEASAGPDPDDPRGLKRKSAGRRPGMVS